MSKTLHKQKWQDAWRETVSSIQIQNQINMLLDGQNFVMFFTYENSLFAAQEPHRVTYARMIKPDSEVSDSWRKDANFIGINLTSMIKAGKPSQQLLYFKDLDKIKIISKDDAAKFLLHLSKENDIKSQSMNIVRQIMGK